jgi:hypothetical protein
MINGVDIRWSKKNKKGESQEWTCIVMKSYGPFRFEATGQLAGVFSEAAGDLAKFMKVEQIALHQLETKIAQAEGFLP